MTKLYFLYFKTCPGIADPKHFKVGITGVKTVRSRLASYQNAVGPVWQEKFIQLWVGYENHIRLAEKSFKREYKHKIDSAEAGLSEWICDITQDELLGFVTELQQEHFLKFMSVPDNFLPLTMALCKDLQDWIEQNLDKSFLE